MASDEKIISAVDAKMLTARKAADMLGCAPDYIGRLCREGKLDGVLHRGAWFVDPVSIPRYEAEREALRVARAEALSQERRQETVAYAYASKTPLGKAVERVKRYFGIVPVVTLPAPAASSRSWQYRFGRKAFLFAVAIFFAASAPLGAYVQRTFFAPSPIAPPTIIVVGPTSTAPIASAVHNTYPVIERTIERSVESVSDLSNFVTYDFLNSQIERLQDSIADHGSGGGGGISDFSSLVASDIPDLSGTYLPLSGGTLSGALVLPYASTTATSTLAGITLTLDCSVYNNGGALTTDSSGNVICDNDDSTAGSGSPGGNNTYVQYNDSGSFGGDAGFTYNKTTDLLTVAFASTTGFSTSYASTTNFIAGSATTTALAIPSITSSLLKTNSLGQVVAAIAGTDYQAAGNYATFAYPFPSNATTTSITFNGGLSGVLTGSLVGNASTATALQTGRTINGVTFDGTANITIAAASSTLLANDNTWSGTNTFSNPIVASITGNAGTVTNGVYTTTFNGLFDTRFVAALAATTSVSSITTLPNLLLPYSQLSGAPTIAAYPFPGNATTTLLSFNGGLSSASTTLTGPFVFANATGTNATTSNFAIGNIISSILKTTAGGSVVAAQPGVDYLTDADVFAYLFPGNATTTQIAFNGGATLNGATTTALAVTGSTTVASVLNVGGAINAASTLSISGAIVSTATDSNVLPYASSTALTVSGAIYGAGLATCNSSVDKLLWSGGVFSCGTDQSSGGGGSDSNWVYFNGSGLRLATTTNQVLIGGSSTSTLLSPLAKLGVIGGASIDYASTTALTATSLYAVAASTTNATTTNLGITGIQNSLLKTVNGVVTAAVAGTDYLTAATTFAYPFPSNATTTLLAFDGGLTSASTTLTGPFVFGNATGTNATTTNFAVSSLTSGRVPFAGTGGTLVDSSALTFSGSTLAVTGGVIQSTSGIFRGDDQYHQIIFHNVGNNTDYIEWGDTLANGGGHKFFTGGASPTLRLQIADDGTYIQGNLGVGTTSPYAKLSVAGQAVAEYFTATSTATSTFPTLLSTNATTTSFAITGVQNALLSTNAQGSVVATSSLSITQYLTGTLGVVNGGTGSTTLGGLLSGNGTSIYSSATGTVASSNGITVTAGQAIIGSGLTITGVDAAADGSTKGVSAYTAADFNDASGVISLDYANGQKASASLAGFLSSADWSVFNNKISSTSLSAGAGIAYNSSTGVITNTIGYPFPSNATTTLLAFNGGATFVGATTTALAVTGSSTISSVLNVGGALAANSTLTVLGNTSLQGATSTSFAISNLTSGRLPYTTTGGSLRDSANLTYSGSSLGLSNGYLSLTSGYGIFALTGLQTQLFYTDHIAVSNNGVEQTTLVASTGNFGIGTSSPYAKLSVAGQVVGQYFTATSTTASTFPYASTTAITATTASTTNLIVSGISNSLLKTVSGVVTAAVAGTDYLTAASIFAYPFPSNATTTLLAFDGGLTSASTTLTGPFAFGSATGTNATTTSLGIAGIASSLLKTTSSGSVVAAAGGTDYEVPLTFSTGLLRTGDTVVNTIGYPFPSNATTTLLAFDGGLTSASTTLTGSTTLANATSTTLFSGRLGGTTFAVGATASTTIDAAGNLAVAGTLTGAGLSSCSGTADKLLWNAGLFSCGVDDTGSGAGSDANWTFFNNSAIRVSTTTNQVLIGASSTSTLAKLEVVGGLFADYATSSLSLFGGTVTGNSAAFGATASTTITSAGFVGIGSSTPSQKLTVAGGTILQTASGNPTLAGSIASTNHTYQTIVSGNYAYSVDQGGGLRIVDVTDPKNPSLISSYAYNAAPAAVSLALSGRYAFVGDTTAGLVILDVSNAASPKVVSTTAILDAPWSMAASGKYLYVADSDDQELKVVDISNPAAPVVAGTFAPGGSGQPYSVAVSGKYAFVGDLGDSKIYIVDISNPAAPALSATYSDSGISPIGLYAAGRYLYVADASEGFYSLDVSSATSTPTLVGSYAGSYFGVAVGGGYAYLADNGGNLVVLSLNLPASPALVGSYATGGNPLSVSVAGKYAYVSDDGGGIKIVDINGASLPTASVGALAANALSVSEDLRVGNNLYADGSLNVGISGIFSRGTIAAYIASSTQTNPVVASFMGGNVGIGTTSPFAALSVAGNGFFTGALTSSILSATTSATLASTTLTGSSLFTNATTSSFAITGISSGNLLKTTTGGAIIAAVAGTDYATLTTVASAYPFQGANNSTSTLTRFTGGLMSLASTTIGGGTAITGLTISGGATTTGNAYFASSVGIGTTSPSAALSINGATNGAKALAVYGGNGVSGADGGGIYMQAGTGASGIFVPGGDIELYGGTGGSGSFPLGGVGGSVYLSPGVAGANGFTSGNVLLGINKSGTAVGNVGIGTILPNNTLQVNGYAAIGFGSQVAIAPSNGLIVLGTTGIGTSSPFAKLAVQANNGETNKVLFAIGSSTASATSTLFSVNNIGSTTLFRLTSSLLKTDSNGTIIAAVAGTDYLTSATTFAYPFPSNATTTLLAFSGGLTSYASTTIGGGTAITGLTISGGATTTGSSYFAGNVGIGTAASSYALDVLGTAHVSGNATFDGTLTAGGVMGGIVLNSGGAGTATIDVAANGLVTLNSSDTITGGFDLTVGGTSMARLSANGNFGVGTTTPWARLSADTSSLAAGVPSFVVGSSTRTDFVITQAGFVGIGTTSPTTYGGSNENFAVSGAGIVQAVIHSTSVGSGNSAGIYLDRADAANGYSNLTYSTNGTQNWIMNMFAGSTDLRLWNMTTNSELVRFSTAHTVGIASTTPWARFSVDTGSLASGVPSFVVGSSTRTDLYIDQAGRVGIGTTSPTGKLDVTSTIYISSTMGATPYGITQINSGGIEVRRDNTSTGGFIDLKDENEDYDFRVAVVGASNILTVSASTTANILNIKANGNVGIGTTTPGSLFAIEGIANFTTGTSTLYNNLNVQGQLKVGTGSIFLNGAATSTFSHGVDIASGCYAVAGACLATGGSLSGTTGQVAYFSSTNTAVGTSSLFISTAGNVGIGTTTPVSLLSVGSYGSGLPQTNSLLVSNNNVQTLGLQGDTTAANISFYANSTTTRFGAIKVGSSVAAGSGSGSGGFFNVYTTDAAATLGLAMTITQDKSVGLSTTTAWARLSVDTTSLLSGVPSFVVGSSTRTDLVITQAGQVGIGTANPFPFGNVGLLNVVGSTTSAYAASNNPQTRIRIDNLDSTTNNFSQLGFGTIDTGGPGTIASAAMINAIFTSHASNAVTSDFSFVTKNAGTLGEVLRITGAGNVGIGTTTPWARSSVDTGSLAAGVPSFVVGSSTRTDLVVTQAGNVGIGTASPLEKLDVLGRSIVGSDGRLTTYATTTTFGSETVVLQTTIDNNSLSTESFVNAESRYSLSLQPTRGFVGIGSTSPYAKLSVTNTGSGPSFVVEDSTSPDTTPFIVDASGNVGIGTTSPSQNLHIFGGASSAIAQLDANAGQATIQVRFGTNNSDYAHLNYSDSTGIFDLNNTRAFPITFSTNNTERIRIDSSGNVGIGTSSPVGRFAVVSADNTLTTNIGEFRALNLSQGVGISYTGIRKLTTNGANDLYIDGVSGTTGNIILNASSGGSTGNVGIGDATPTAKLTFSNNVATGFLDNYSEYQLMTYDSASAATSYGLGIKNNTMVFNSGAGAYSFDRAGSATTMVLDTAGYVGIGTTTPAMVLSVNGTTGVPNTSGSTVTAGILRLENTSTSLHNVLDFGTYSSSPYGAWLQVRNRYDMSSNFPLVLNPNGGSIGIGTTSPASLFSVAGNGYLTGNLGVGLQNTGSAGTLMWGSAGTAVGRLTYGLPGASDVLVDNALSGGGLGFRVNANAGTSLFINSSGNVGIASTTPWARMSVDTTSLASGVPSFVVGSSTRTDFAINQAGHISIGASTMGNANHMLDINADTSTATNVVFIGLGDLNGTLGTNPTLYLQAGNGLTGVVSRNNHPLTLWTNNSEKVRIDTSGNVGIGSTSPTIKLSVVGAIVSSGGLWQSDTGGSYVPVTGVGAASVINFQGAGSDYGLVLMSRAGGSTPAVLFRDASAGTSPGSITFTSTVTTYNTTSDRRIKSNFASTTNGLDTLLKIAVQDFNFISDPSGARTQGFIAQDLYRYYPEAVTTNGDDGEGPLVAPMPWQVDYGRVTPLIVRAVQELNAKLDLRTLGLATTTPQALVDGPFASATDALKQALTSVLDAVEGIAQAGVRTLGQAVYASVGIFDKVLAQTLTATVVNADTVNTNELCIDGVCINKDQLQQILNGSGNNGGAEEPPVEEPPAEEPPADEPPADDPPAEEPPADEPPADGGSGGDEGGDTPLGDGGGGEPTP